MRNAAQAAAAGTGHAPCPIRDAGTRALGELNVHGKALGVRGRLPGVDLARLGDEAFGEQKAHEEILDMIGRDHHDGVGLPVHADGERRLFEHGIAVH